MYVGYSSSYKHTSLEETADSTIDIIIEKWVHQEQNAIVAWIENLSDDDFITL